MDYFVLVAYASWQLEESFCNSYQPVWTLLWIQKLYSVCTKEVISMNYGSGTSWWKPWRWVSFNLILTMRDTYVNVDLNPLTKFTSRSSRKTEFKDILPWNISQMIMKTIPISTRIVISYAMKQDTVFSLLESQWKLRQQQDQKFQCRESRCKRNINIRINKSKRAGLCESQWGIQAGKLDIWVRSFEEH